MEERLAWGATLEDILKELDIDPEEVFEDQKREIASFFICARRVSERQLPPRAALPQ